MSEPNIDNLDPTLPEKEQRELIARMETLIGSRSNIPIQRHIRGALGRCSRRLVPSGGHLDRKLESPAWRPIPNQGESIQVVATFIDDPFDTPRDVSTFWEPYCHIMGLVYNMDNIQFSQQAKHWNHLRRDDLLPYLLNASKPYYIEFEDVAYPKYPTYWKKIHTTKAHHDWLHKKGKGFDTYSNQFRMRIVSLLREHDISLLKSDFDTLSETPSNMFGTRDLLLDNQLFDIFNRQLFITGQQTPGIRDRIHDAIRAELLYGDLRRIKYLVIVLKGLIHRMDPALRKHIIDWGVSSYVRRVVIGDIVKVVESAIRETVDPNDYSNLGQELSWLINAVEEDEEFRQAYTEREEPNDENTEDDIIH